MSERSGRGLTRSQFDRVIRRAVELASEEADAGDGEVSEADLFRIAGDVGLGEPHVRRALAELHAEGGEARVLDRIFGPSTVRTSRVVPGSPDEVAGTLDDFFVASQLLQPVRRGPHLLQYRPAVDWASQLARAASFTSRKYYVASAKSVEVRLDAVEEDRTVVAFAVDPGTRSDRVLGAALGGGSAGVAAGMAAGVALAPAVPVLAGVGVGVAVGCAVASGVVVAVARGHRNKLLEVRGEVEGILDRLEAGGSLQPPPASWLRWVKRQFHGVARDLARTEDESVPPAASRDRGGARTREP